MFNCLDCKPSFWGNYAVPPRPRGAYRTLAQLQDAMGCPRRLYASALLDCAGRIEKHDNLYPIDLNFVFFRANSGALYVPDGDFYDGHGATMNNTALGADIFFAARGNPLFWAWQCFWCPSKPNPVRLFLAHVTSTTWTWYDSVDMTPFVYPASAPYAGAAVGWMLLNKAPSVFGDPWLNAI